MSTNLAAMYEQAATAEQARSELLTKGFHATSVDLISSERDLGGYPSGPEGYFRSIFDESTQEDYVACFTEGVRRGATVVSVREADDSECESIKSILNSYDPLDLDECRRDWNIPWAQRTESPASEASDTERSIPVVEEQLEVGKRQVQGNGARIVSRVRSQPVEETVHLRDEVPTVERRRVDRPATEADLQAAQDQDIELRETREEPVVSKTARVTEEVTVGQKARERTQKIRDDVKRTEVDVEKPDESTDRDGNPRTRR